MELTPMDYAAHDFLVMMSEPETRCEVLAHPEPFNLVFSILIIIGIAVSYIPQYVSIIRSKSSSGISSYFPLLGAISSSCSFINILILPTSLTDMGCCKEISGGACAAAMLGVIQMGVQWASFFTVLLLFVVYPRSLPTDLEHTAIDDAADSPPIWEHPYAVGALSVFHLIATAIVSILLLEYSPQLLQGWATVLGATASIFAAIQYLPQIHTTYIRKDAQSFSIGMLLIQCPGSFVWATSLLLRLGQSGWTVWGMLYLTAFLQACLLSLALYYSSNDHGIKLPGGAHRPLLADPQSPASNQNDEEYIR